MTGSFNSAATSPSRKTLWKRLHSSVVKPLQFGRDVTVAEDVLGGIGAGDPIERFNSAATSPSRKTTLARHHKSLIIKLQFGRDVTVAEDHTPDSVYGFTWTLQFGRDVTVAEDTS